MYIAYFLIVKSTDDYALVMLCYALETFVSGIVALFIAQKIRDQTSNSLGTRSEILS